MNVGSTDVSARRVFVEALGHPEVALRSRMHPDDIRDVEIVGVQDADIAATRKVLRIASSTDATCEIDGNDVLESVDVASVELASRASSANLAGLTASVGVVRAPSSAAFDVLSVIDTLDVRAVTSVTHREAAVVVHAGPLSTGAVTLALDGTAEQTRSGRPEPRVGAIVGMFFAAAVTLVVSAAITEKVRGAESSSTASPAVAAEPPTTPAPMFARATPAPLPTLSAIDVNSLPPAALVGAVVVPQHRAGTSRPRAPRTR